MMKKGQAAVRKAVGHTTCKLWARVSAKNVKQLRRRDQGSSTVEFILWFPIFILLFLTSFELSFFGMRMVLLERAVDLSVRDLRLGIIRPANHTQFKEEICNNAMLFSDCVNAIALDLQVIDTADWQLPWGRVDCVDRENDITPHTSLARGQAYEMMLVRPCIVVDPFFASTPFVLGMPRDASGGVSLVTTSTYVNEP
jgi:Flp pilus assembly protein TadG